jgi:pilus assembly protein CpaE
MTVVVDNDTDNAHTLANAIVGGATTLPSLDHLRRHLDENPRENVVVLGVTVDAGAAFNFARSARVTNSALGVILVRRRLDTSTLAEALRSGVREVVTDRELSALSDAVRRANEVGRQIRQQVEGASEEGDDVPRGRLVTIFSAKGGCGKTTIATNLAVALADRGRREVCLVDLDLAFGDVAIALQLFPAHTIADAVGLAGSLDEAGLASLLTPHSPGLTTLVAPLEPGAAEGIPASLVADILRILKGMFDYVVVDTPPAFTDHVLAAFDASEVLGLLATLDVPALKNLKLTLETLDLLNYPRDKWRVILNRADAKVGLALHDVEATLSAAITAQIPSSRNVPASINRGVPIVLDDPNHPVSLAIKQLAEQHVASVPAAGSIPDSLRRDRRGGFLRRKAPTT